MAEGWPNAGLLKASFIRRDAGRQVQIGAGKKRK